MEFYLLRILVASDLKVLPHMVSDLIIHITYNTLFDLVHDNSN